MRIQEHVWIIVGRDDGIIETNTCAGIRAAAWAKWRINTLGMYSETHYQAQKFVAVPPKRKKKA